MQRLRGWDSCDWESFSSDKSGHDALVHRLEELVETLYPYLNRLEFVEEEASIAEKHGRKPHYYVAHRPDLIIADSPKPESRIFIEYVNTPSSYLRDLRGMLALSARVKQTRGFVLALRHSAFPEKQPTKLPAKSPVEIMSLRSLLFALDKHELGYLVGET